MGLFLKENYVSTGQTVPKEGAKGGAAHCP